MLSTLKIVSFLMIFVSIIWLCDRDAHAHKQQNGDNNTSNCKTIAFFWFFFVSINTGFFVCFHPRNYVTCDNSVSNCFTEYVTQIFHSDTPKTTISRQQFVFYIKKKECIFFRFCFLGIHRISFKLSWKEIYWTMIVLFLFFSSRILHPISSISQNAN